MDDEKAKIIYTLREAPWYFGAYLNMARHNIFLISNEIRNKIKSYSKTNFPELKNEEEIPNSFLTNESLVNKDHVNLIYSNITRFMPLAKIFSSDFSEKISKEETEFKGVDIKSMATFFKTGFKELNDFRNDYSHYYSYTTLDKKKINVPDHFADSLRSLFILATSYAENRFKGILPSSSFKHIREKMTDELFNNGNEITTMGLSFFCCLFLDKENAFHFINRVKGLKDTRTFDFLATREVLTVFCVKLPHNKFTSEDPLQALQLDMLNYLNRTPIELYNAMTEEGKKQFQPQLSEFSKENIKDNSINDTIEEPDFDEYIKAFSSMKRHEDRFAEFALKYLDLSEDFNINFQIHLGKSKVKCYPKALLGKIPKEANRNIFKDIKTFGKLSSFLGDNAKIKITEENEFKKLFKGENVEFFSQYASHYHIANNKIGLLLPDNKKYYGKLYRPLAPTAFLSIHELPKVALLEYLEKGKAAQLITDFITLNNQKIINRSFIETIKNQLNLEGTLKRVVFDERFTKTKGSEKDPSKAKNLDQSKGDEKSIKEIKIASYEQYVSEVNQRKERLNDLLAEYGLNAKQIPTRILDYWLKVKPVDTKTIIKNRIRAERKDCKRRLNNLTQGKVPKVGEMATSLAKDIINLIINRECKQRITSFYYDLLQECLALLNDPVKKQLFINICGKDLKLFEKQTGHPFLSVIPFNDIHNTKDLYRTYFDLKGCREKQTPQEQVKDKTIKEDERIPGNWLSKTFYIVQKDESTKRLKTIIQLPDEAAIPYSYSNFKKDKSNLDTWLSSIAPGENAIVDEKGKKSDSKSKPVDLPTNLFDKELNRALKQKIQGKTENLDVYNYSKLLALWQNEIQPFYQNTREYIIFKGQPYQTIIRFEPNTASRFNEYYHSSIESTFRKRKEINKKIQKEQIARVFKKAIDENEKAIRFFQTKDRITLLLLKDLMKKDFALSLKDISPTSKKSPLNKSVEIKQNIYGKSITDRRKQKDCSVFNRFLYDRRLASLFSYYPEDVIPYTDLKQELEDYNKYKERIFMLIFELEKAIIDLTTEDELLAWKEDSKTSNIEHKQYLKWLKEYNLINESEKEFYGEIRNKFFHNQFPLKEVVEKTIPNLKRAETFSSQIALTYINRIDNLINKKLIHSF